MKRILTALIVLLFAVPALAADVPAKEPECTGYISKDSSGMVTLRARDVKSVENGVMAYDLGCETIFIKANDEPNMRRFLQDVRDGNKTAVVTVTLDPVRRIPSNMEFKVRTAHY